MATRCFRRRRTDEYRRILCPTDFSLLANVGVEQAARRAARDRAGLLLLHVCPPVTAYAAAEIPGGILARFVEQDREDAWAGLCRVRDRLRQTGVVTHALVVEGYPAEQITRIAGRLRCDLIVLATRGRSGLSRVFFGSSMAERVIRHAPCPVLTYCPPRAVVRRRFVPSHVKAAA